MPRTPYGQLWAGRASSSTSSDDDRSGNEYDYFASDLSELESESEFTRNTEDESLGDLDNDCRENYVFKLRENVWVKPRGCLQWFWGTVVKVREPSKDSKKRGLLYLVVFRRHYTNMRDTFSSREGNIKPDTPHVRALICSAT